MVTNLLDLGRIEAGALRADREAIAVDAAVADAVERYRSRLASREVTYAWPGEPPVVFADPVFLGQVLANLLENAATFVPPEGRIRVGSRAGRRHGPDHGRGFRAGRPRGIDGPPVREVLPRRPAAGRVRVPAPGSPSCSG